MKRALAIALLLFVSCSSPTVGALRSSPSSAATMFTLTNQARQSEGISLLASSQTMTHYAEIHSAAMVSRNKLEHSSLPDGIVAENVGVTPADPGWEQTLQAAFMHSPGHRFNILDGRLKTLGLGVVISDGYAWVTEEYGLGDEIPPKAVPRPTCSPIVRTNCSYRFVP